MFIKFKYKQKILIKGLTGKGDKTGALVEHSFKRHCLMTVSINNYLI